MATFSSATLPYQRLKVGLKYYRWIGIRGRPKTAWMEGVTESGLTYNAYQNDDETVKALEIRGTPSKAMSGEWTIYMSADSTQNKENATRATVNYDILDHLTADFERAPDGTVAVDIDDLERHKLTITFSEVTYLTTSAFRFDGAEVIDAWVSSAADNDKTWYLYFVPADNQAEMLSISIAGTVYPLETKNSEELKVVRAPIAVVPINTREPQVVETFQRWELPQRLSVFYAFNLPVTGITSLELNGANPAEMTSTQLRAWRIYAADSIEGLHTNTTDFRGVQGLETPLLDAKLYENTDEPKQFYRIDIDFNTVPDDVTLQLPSGSIEAAYREEILVGVPSDFTGFQWTTTQGIATGYPDLAAREFIEIPFITPNTKPLSPRLRGTPEGINAWITAPNIERPNEFCLKMTGTPKQTGTGAFQIYLDGTLKKLIPWTVTD